MSLSAEQLRQFHDKGYIKVPGFVNPTTIATLRDEIDNLHARMATDCPDDVGVSWEEGLDGDRAPKIRQLMHSEKVSPTLDNILRSEAMLDIIEQLVGPEIVLFHSKLMMKSALDGTFTPWHQDWGYWRHNRSDPSQINCMLSIDPATIENGCIRFVPGSHKSGAMDHKAFNSASFNIGLEGDLDAFDAVAVETEAGDAVFFGCMVIHGSGPNESPQHRRANTFAFDKPHNQKEEARWPQADKLLQRTAAAV